MFRESYTCSIAFAGNIAQVRFYDKPVLYGVAESSDVLSFSASSDALASSSLSSLLVKSVTSQEFAPPPEGLETLAEQVLTAEEKVKKEASLARRARARFSQKVSSNFGLYSEALQQASGKYLKFLTLTIKRNITERSEAHALFAGFIDRLSYHAGEVEYACVPERQQRGAWHYHLIIRSEFIRKGVLKKIWSDRADGGSWYVEKIASVRNVGAYVSKYMAKSFETVKDSKAKRFYTSKGLKDLTVMCRASRATIEWLKPFAGMTPAREYSFEADWVGKVDFFEYVFPNTAAQEIAAIQQEVTKYAFVS
jgi:hypothetical protein